MFKLLGAAVLLCGAAAMGCSSSVEGDPSGNGGAGGAGAGGGGEGAGGTGGRVPIATPECQTWLGDETDEDALWLGFVAPLSGDFAFIGETIGNGVRLQHEELHEAVGFDPSTQTVTGQLGCP